VSTPGSSGFENRGVASDLVQTVDEIKDRIDAVWVRRAQRIDHLDGSGVIDLFGTEAASLVDVAANGRNDVCASGARHLHRVAADAAGRAHHNEALAAVTPSRSSDPSAVIAAMGSAVRK
jgi:hypothetical protein